MGVSAAIRFARRAIGNLAIGFLLGLGSLAHRNLGFESSGLKCD